MLRLAYIKKYSRPIGILYFYRPTETSFCRPTEAITLKTYLTDSKKTLQSADRRPITFESGDDRPMNTFESGDDRPMIGRHIGR